MDNNVEQDIFYSKTYKTRRTFIILLFLLIIPFIFFYRRIPTDLFEIIEFTLIIFIATFYIIPESSIQIRPTEIRKTLRLFGLFDLVTFKSVQYTNIDHIELIKFYRFNTLKGMTKDRKSFTFSLNDKWSNSDDFLQHLHQKIEFDLNPKNTGTIT